MGEGIDEIAVGVFLEALQRHGTSSCIPYQALQLIAPVRRNLGVGVEGKPVDTGAARTSEPGRLVRIAKARADAAPVLSSSFSTGDALLDRSRHGAGELWCGVAQGIIPGGHGGIHARLQIAEPTQLTDDAVTDLLEDRGNVRIAGRFDFDKAGLAARCGAIEVDTLHEDTMEMEVGVRRRLYLIV